MDHALITLFCFILIIIGIIGTIVPVLPGLILSVIGLLIFKFGTNSQMPMLYVWIFGVLTLLSAVLDYVIPARTNKKYGGTRWGSIGSLVGTLLGFFFIPIPFGFLIGMLLGVFIGELIHDINDRKKAFNSTKGALIGFIYGTGFNVMVGIAMLFVVIYYTFF